MLLETSAFLNLLRAAGYTPYTAYTSADAECVAFKTTDSPFEVCANLVAKADRAVTGDLLETMRDAQSNKFEKCSVVWFPNIQWEGAPVEPPDYPEVI